MARASLPLIDAIRSTALQLQTSDHYQWGHMGACNCGFLAQQVTQLSKAEIHSRALIRYGDWNEQLNDYCPTSGLLFDDVISQLLQIGFDIEDLKHLENLSDPAVLNALGSSLQRNRKSDVVLYLTKWAELLERNLLSTLTLPDLTNIPNFVTAR
jgi:hypothetical protein